MNVQNALLALLAAATLGACATGRTQTASDPDPDVAPCTSEDDDEVSARSAGASSGRSQ